MMLFHLSCPCLGPVRTFLHYILEPIDPCPISGPAPTILVSPTTVSLSEV